MTSRDRHFRHSAVRIQFVCHHNECFVGTVMCMFVGTVMCMFDQNKTLAVNCLNKKLILHFSKTFETNSTRHKLLYCSVRHGDYNSSVVSLFRVVSTHQCDIFLSIFKLPLKRS
jgi:hypothetical protein